MRYLVLLMVLVLTVLSYAQTERDWVARYNGPGNSADTPMDIVVDNNGYIYVTGTSYGESQYEDYLTIKYDYYGDTVWTARYSNLATDSDAAHAIFVDDDGNVYVTGQSKGSGTHYDCATVKYNPDGEEQWVARYNGPDNAHDAGQAVMVDGAGNVYVTGYCDPGGYNYNCITIKYNFSGEQQWLATYEGTGGDDDFGFFIALDEMDNVYVTGKSQGTGGSDFDYITLKYNSGGTLQWVARQNGSGNGVDTPTDMAVDGNGYIYVTGYSWGGSSQDYDAVTLKYNSNGDLQWGVRYNGPENEADYANALAFDEMNNIYLTGYTYTASGNDMAVWKINPAGEPQWLYTYDGPYEGSDYGQDIVINSLGDVFAGGYSAGENSPYDFAMIQLNANGDSLYTDRYNGPGNGWEMGVSMASALNGMVYLTGKSQGDGTSNDYTTIKYDVGTGIENQVNTLPESYGLSAYPNPFNARVLISYNLPFRSMVKLSIYDILGRKIAVIQDGYKQAGNHSVAWYAGEISSGIYFYRLEARDYIKSNRMVLVK